jgi:hypothetical protein
MIAAEAIEDAIDDAKDEEPQMTLDAAIRLRDPRKDPQPGDVLRKPLKTGGWRYRQVEGRSGDDCVEFSVKDPSLPHSPDSNGSSSLVAWKAWCRESQVVAHRATRGN